MKNQIGFAAYVEVQTLAKNVYHGHRVDVQAAIFGDDYVIIVDNSEVLHGSTASVIDELKLMLGRYPS